MELARPFIPIARLSQVELTGRGIEFVVFKASSQQHGRVALRVPVTKVFQTVNDQDLSARDLVQQELRIYKLLRNTAVPVPEPYEYLEVDEYPAMLCEYVDDDGSEVSAEELGRMAALIHSTPVSPDWQLHPVAHEGSDALTTIANRIQRRFIEFAKAEPGASSWTPSPTTLHTIANRIRHLPFCLLHLDLRAANLRVRDGRIAAVVDWSNTMIGAAAIDVFRVLGLGQPGDGFRETYGRIALFPEVGAEEELLLRLDAALMLALVFISEEPNEGMRGPAVERVEQLARQLIDSPGVVSKTGD